MTHQFWTETKEELSLGITEKGHPFRYATLATVGNERLPRLRTIVLRHLGPDLKLTFYTDRRSKKVLHIKENNRLSLLFYHPEKLLQIKVEGLAFLITNSELKEKYWKQVNENSKKDYTTHIAPGSTVSDPSQVEYLTENNYFCPIEIEPFKIEYLKLKRPNHLRIRFSKEDDEWNGEFLVP